jgi:RNAse (barnase) inhibitor barstar
MREVILDGSDWATKDDVYDAFFDVVGAPEWNGRNLDALADSIAGGQINQVEAPYRFVITNYSQIATAVKETTDNFVNLVRELARKGCPVEIRVDAQ